MESATEKPVAETVHAKSGRSEFMHLDLEVRDAIVIKYLSTFDEFTRGDKALEALRVGVIAIQSASPTLDTRVVEEKFREVEHSIEESITSFQNDARTRLEEYFKADSGSVPRLLETAFGDGGTVTQLLNQYFGADGGRVSRLLQEQLGPSSQFVKSLDPQNKESVISRIEAVVKSHLEQKTNEIVRQFSLDQADSALSRLKLVFTERIGEVQAANTKLFADLKGALGVKAGVELGAEKGTEKGREFETDLYRRVAETARLLADSTE